MKSIHISPRFSLATVAIALGFLGFFMTAATQKSWERAAKVMHSPCTSDSVGLAAVSPDHRLIALAATNGSVSIMEAATGQERLCFATKRNLLHAFGSLSFSEKSDHVILCDFGHSGGVEVWDVVSGTLVTTVTHAGDTDLTPKIIHGKFVVSGTDGGGATMWPLDSTNVPVPLRKPDCQLVSKVDFSETTDTLAVMGSLDPNVYLWHIPNAPVPQPQPRVLNVGMMRDICLSPSGQQMAMLSRSGTVSVFLMADERLSWKAESSGYDHAAVRFSRDGTLLVATSPLEPGQILNASTGSRVSVLGWHSRTIRPAAFSLSGEAVLTLSDHGIFVWDTTAGSSRGVLRPHADGRFLVAWWDDDERIHAVETTGLIGTWEKVRSERWYFRPAWWVTGLIGGALVFSIRRDRKSYLSLLYETGSRRS